MPAPFGDMGFFLITVLVLTAVLSWWISGFDPKLTGENTRQDLIRRSIRCGLTLILMAGGLVEAMADLRFASFIAIILAFPMVLLWLNCLAEALAHAFHSLVDSPSESSGASSKELKADLDRLAELSNRGQTNEALQLCGELLNKGDASRLAIETLCFRLYGQVFADESFRTSLSLSHMYQLCENGEFAEAECRLTQIIQGDRENLQAVFLLIRLYTRNLEQPEKVGALIQSLETKSELPPMFVSYVNHRIREWQSSSDEKSDEGIESLLASKKIL